MAALIDQLEQLEQLEQLKKNLRDLVDRDSEGRLLRASELLDYGASIVVVASRRRVASGYDRHSSTVASSSARNLAVASSAGRNASNLSSATVTSTAVPKCVSVVRSCSSVSRWRSRRGTANPR